MGTGRAVSCGKMCVVVGGVLPLHQRATPHHTHTHQTTHKEGIGGEKASSTTKLTVMCIAPAVKGAMSLLCIVVGGVLERSWYVRGVSQPASCRLFALLHVHGYVHVS